MTQIYYLFQDSFTDILSAALDESGITGDFEAEQPETRPYTQHVYQGQSQPIVSTCLDQSTLYTSYRNPWSFKTKNNSLWSHFVCSRSYNCILLSFSLFVLCINFMELFCGSRWVFISSPKTSDNVKAKGSGFSIEVLGWSRFWFICVSCHTNSSYSVYILYWRLLCIYWCVFLNLTY